MEHSLYLINNSNEDAIRRWNAEQQNNTPVDTAIGQQFFSDDSLNSRRSSQWSRSAISVNNDGSPSYIDACVSQRIKVLQDSTAMRGYLRSYKIEKSPEEISPAVFLRETTDTTINIVDKSVKELKGLKLWLSLIVEFEKATDKLETIKAYFGSDAVTFLPTSSIKQSIEDMNQKILNSVESFQQNGSGWVTKKILHLCVNIAKYGPLRGSSYSPLPRYIAKKKAVINVKNNDNQCFKWAILSALHPQASNAHRVSKYVPYRNQLNFMGINFPVSLTDIPRFEDQNCVSVSVYGYDGSLYPLYLSRKPGRKISLLYYKRHYSFIKSLDRLLSDQNRHNGRKYVCPYCLFAFYKKDRLDEHVTYCETDNPCRIQMPSADESTLSFKNMHKMLRQVFVIYADFECFTQKIYSCDNDPRVSFTEKYQLHKPCGYGLIGVRNCCNSASYDTPEVFRGQDAVLEFLKRILQLTEDYQNILERPCPLNITPAEDISFRSALVCHICGEQLGEDRVRDHCHVCGRYRGSAHNKCNQLFRLNGDVVVVFHNLRRYDGHLLMQEIGTACNEKKLTLECIAKGLEDYITFSIRQTGHGRHWKIKFIDSCQFLLSSLGNLVSTLAPERFSAMKTYFKDNIIELMLRKGIYPYDYVDCWERFCETSLPAKDKFYNILVGENISDEDYTHACQVWSAFDIKNIGEYHDLYLVTDVLLLADVFENFRIFGLSKYGLDPCHYFTLPSLAWDACLKLTKVKLELLSEPDMYQFFERGIRGGISMISHRYARANNRFISHYNEALPTSYIIYLDANNLYGWSMVNYLPHSQFRWLSDQEMSELDWKNLPSDADVGYVLEVDLVYPERLHDIHDSYPVAPEKMAIRQELLSPYCKDLLRSLNKSSVEQEKLVPNLLPKYNYIVHYRNLQLYQQLGLEVRKVHRIVSFRQEPWMRAYIEFNTEMRKVATCPFQKDMLKLFNNAVFGKTCENQRNRKDVKLPTRRQQFRKLVANPRYERSCAFNEDLAGVIMSKKSVLLNKPIYAGFAVLDLSKLLMYEFHYGYMLQKHPNVRLLFTDTDSLCYFVQTDDIYLDMLDDLDQFDTSEYSRDHFLFSDHNRKVLGKMKDETSGDPIEEFVGLRPKMYSFLCKGVAKKRAKGIKKSVVRKKISHEQYLAILNDRREQKNSMNLIRSERHVLYSLTLNKTSLSCYDDKRYLLGDGITSYAYGNKRCN